MQAAVFLVKMVRTTRKRAKIDTQASQAVAMADRSSSDTAKLKTSNAGSDSKKSRTISKKAKLNEDPSSPVSAGATQATNKPGPLTESKSRSRSKPAGASTIAKFQDEDDFVQFEVEGEEAFTSDGELDSSDSETEGAQDTAEEVESVQDEEVILNTSSQESHHSNNNATVAMDEDEAELESVVSWQVHKNRGQHKAPPLRPSMEQKLDTLTNAVVAMQDMMKQQGILPSGNTSKRKVKQDKVVRVQSPHRDDSVTTIYQNALQKGDEDTADCLRGVPETLKRISTSSEEINTSDELVDLEFNDRLFLGQERAGPLDASDDRWALQRPMVQVANQVTE